MVVSRGPKGVMPFGLGLLTFILAPSAIGSQELAALIARQTSTTERPVARMSTFGAAQAATFNLPRPVSAAMPVSLSYTLAGLDTSYADMIGSIRERMLGEATAGVVALPVPDRRLKGDRLPLPQEAEPSNAGEAGHHAPDDAGEEPALQAADPPVRKSDRLPLRTDTHPASVAPPKQDRDTFQLASVDRNAIPSPDDTRASQRVVLDDARPEIGELADVPDMGSVLAEDEAEPGTVIARVYFSAEPLGDAPEQVQPWPTGEGPSVETLIVAVDPQPQPASYPSETAALEQRPAATETIAGKGEVTGEGRRPMTPAEQLGLHAVYFESRGEPVRGQIAVAQVVLNRAFSGYYPSNVCGVVYQNAQRYLRCQFTFACDRHPDVVRDQEAWQRADAIAAGALDGKLWLPEIGKATHYHATYVRPAWARTMHRLHRVGVHVFYRPRRWGDGEDAPAWGDATATAEAVRAL
jgi:hypothetical protein